MRSLGLLLLLLVCAEVATPTPILDRDGADFHSGYRSARFGETIRDWFKMVKDRVVEKWHQWFDDNPVSRLLPKDVLNIDRTIQNRAQNYPGFFLDLSNLSFDPEDDWGVRLGNWYLIRKIIGEDCSPDSDSDGDDWDARPSMPGLPSLPIPKTPDWKPNVYDFDIPEVTRRQPPATTTPRIESTTTFRRETTRAAITPPITQSSATSTEATVTSTPRISNESPVTRNESVAVSTTESTLTSTESTTISTESNVMLTEPVVVTTTTHRSTVPSTELIATSVESTATSTESILTSTESAMIVTESIATPSQPIETTTELILPVFNKKRVEDNETVIKRTKKPGPASAEVIM